MKGLIHNTTMRLVAALAAIALGLGCAGAQGAALKTNLAYDALLTPSLGIEAQVAGRWTLELTGSLNAWAVDGRRWKQWSVQPEARYWLCQAFAGNFFGLHLIGGQYNFGNLPFNFRFLGTNFGQLRDSRFQGWMAGAGLAYGHAWILARHWSLEAEIGLGWVRTRYDRFQCGECGRKTASGVKHDYLGPTKAAINLIYAF